MKGKIKTNKYIYSVKRDLILGKGVKLSLDQATEPMIEFLSEAYKKDEESVEGDIGKLLAKSVAIALQKERKLKKMQAKKRQQRRPRRK